MQVDSYGTDNNNNKRLLRLALESTPSCYHGDCSKCANHSVVCHDGVLDNLRNYFMFLAFKKFYNLNINKNDEVVLLETLKLKLSVASVEQMELYTYTENCEAVDGVVCLLMNLLMDLLMHSLVNLSTNSVQIVINEQFCVCMDK